MSQPAPNSQRLAVEQYLRQTNDEWVKAIVRGDIQTLDRIMADDFCFVYPMEGNNKAQFLEDVVFGQIKVEYLNRDNVTVKIGEHTALLSADDSAKWSYQGHNFIGQYKVVHIYAERNHQWQLVAVQACPMM